MFVSELFSRKGRRSIRIFYKLYTTSFSFTQHHSCQGSTISLLRSSLFDLQSCLYPYLYLSFTRNDVSKLERGLSVLKLTYLNSLTIFLTSHINLLLLEPLNSSIRRLPTLIDWHLSRYSFFTELFQNFSAANGFSVQTTMKFNSFHNQSQANSGICKYREILRVFYS